MSRTRSRSIRSKMANPLKSLRGCCPYRKSPGCGEHEGNDEARMTKEVLMTKSERTREHDDAFWLDGETLIIREEPGSKPVYDLEERTARFGEAVIDFAKKIPRDPLTERII